MESCIAIWLKWPFPFYTNMREKITIPLYIGLSIALILILFNPSRNAEQLHIQLYKILVYVFIAFITAATFNTTIPPLFPSLFHVNRWNIGKMVAYTGVKLLAIGAANALFAFYFDNPSENQHFLPFLLHVIYYTVIVAVIPVLLFIFILEKQFYKKHYRLALAAGKQFQRMTNEPESDKQFVHEGFTIPLAAIWYLKSEGNYTTFCYKKDGEVKKALIRILLKEVEQQIASKDLVRCHKSYMVNLKMVGMVEGNARQCCFHLKKINITIPISRSLSKL
jgi:Response regulator of the LytR/AlgR family